MLAPGTTTRAVHRANAGLPLMPASRHTPGATTGRTTPGGMAMRGRRTRGVQAWRLTLLGTLGLLAGCGAMEIRPMDRSPTPLVEALPLDAGLYLDPEFRKYVYKEKRWNADWVVALGEAGVAHASRMAKASFRSVREVRAPDAAGEPPVALVLAPRIEEFAFVTPRDAGGALYQATLRFRMNVHDGQGRLVDSLVYTGYGAAPGGGMSSETPLAAATEAALRDAGAKFLTEFPVQPVIQQLLRGETPTPVPQPVPLVEPPKDSAKDSPKETP